MENIGEKTECILEVNAFSKEESDQFDYSHSVSEGYTQTMDYLQPTPDYAPENSISENSIEDYKTSPPELLCNENCAFIPANEYYEMMYKNKLGRTTFYTKYIHGKHPIPYIRMPRKGKGGRGNEYVLLIDKPEILRKLIEKKKLKEEVEGTKKIFWVNIPGKMLGEFQSVMTSYSPLYKEFLNYLRSEENRDKILKKEGRSKKKRVEIHQEHYNLLLNYSRELNVKVSDVFPILLNHFIKYKMGGDEN